MDFLQTVVLAVIEGLTEFLPVSSTGHMILATALMGIEPTDFVKLFTIAIQLGTILSVLVLYWRRFFRSFGFYLKLAIGFLPAAVFGLLFNDFIDDLLESPLTVAIVLVIGGVILLFVDRWFLNPKVDDADEISYIKALKIGFYQCLAMIPGTSRSGASIVGGMAEGLSRKAAAEFSFFLAVPTMFAATAYKLLKYFTAGNSFTPEELKLLGIGNLVGFLVAVIAIKSFIGYVTKYGFKVFGWYRIIVGLAIIALWYFGGQDLNVL